MESIYTKYIHKSRILCYPQLGIPRNPGYAPVQTYVSCKNKYAAEDMKLTLVYKDYMSSRAQFVLKKYVYSSAQLAGQEALPDNTLIIWFDFSQSAEDWNHFLHGRYSKFSKEWKRKILSFYAKNPGNFQVINKVLHPHYYYPEIAQFFNVPVEIVRETREIMDIPDLTKEECTLYELKEVSTL